MKAEALYQMSEKVKGFDDRIENLAESVRYALREIVKVAEKLKEMTNTVRNEVINKDADSLTIGTPTNGQLKVYGDLNEPKAMRKKIDNALVCLDHAENKKQADENRPAEGKG